jgi:hypothetical protein
MKKRLILLFTSVFSLFIAGDNISKRKTSKAVFMVIILLSWGFAPAGTWTTLDYPGSVETCLYGIDSGNIVGIYTDAQGYRHGFVYNGTNWTILNGPGGAEAYPNGIDGGNIVGTSNNHGFLYDGTNWTTLDFPSASLTRARGIDGGNIVGDYDYIHGFIYNGASWTTIDFPGATTQATLPNDIDGSYIVGCYSGSGQIRGFVYDGINWIAPNAPGADRTYIYGVDGGNIVGYCKKATGRYVFIYDGTNWTILEGPVPATYEIRAYGIDGNKIVGYYHAPDGKDHGFLYTIPEPATILLLTLGGLFLMRRHK